MPSRISFGLAPSVSKAISCSMPRKKLTTRQRIIFTCIPHPVRWCRLRKNRVDTIQGKLRFDGPSNYGDDLMRVKQVQNGRWVTVWPKEAAAPGAALAGP